jgi:hypothetical protein
MGHSIVEYWCKLYIFKVDVLILAEFILFFWNISIYSFIKTEIGGYQQTESCTIRNTQNLADFLDIQDKPIHKKAINSKFS